MTKEDLQQIREVMRDEVRQIVKEELVPINERLDGIDSRLDNIEEQITELKEDTTVTRSVLNDVVHWVDVNFRHKYPFPVDDIVNL